MSQEIQYGAVLVFRKGTTFKEVKVAMELLYRQSLLDHTPSIHNFIPEHGGPVWYIP